MKRAHWLLTALLASAVPLTASAGFGFSMNSDDGFHSWDPRDYPYGYPPYGPYGPWSARPPRHKQGKSVHKDWSDKWDDDYTSRFTFGPENFHFGDSWNDHWGDRWGRYRRPWGAPPWGYYPPARPYAPPPWGWGPAPYGRRAAPPAPRPSQRVWGKPQRPPKPAVKPASKQPAPQPARPKARKRPTDDKPAGQGPTEGPKPASKATSSET